MSNRGLHNFLTEIYSGATKQDIDTRINIELAKIKKAFFSPKISSYNRKKYITKLCFIVLSGIKVCFGLPQIIDLIESKKISSQRIGWMAAVIICGNDSNQINELMPIIEKHLVDSKNENGINFTLSAIASIGGTELAETFGPTIVEIALSTNYFDYTRKKALLTLVSFYRCSQLQLIDTIAGRLTPLLSDSSYGLRLSACHLIHTIQFFQPSSIFDVFTQILEILTNFFIKGEYDHEFSTSDIPCSILSAQMIRILSFNTDWNSSDIKSFENIGINILNRFNLKRSEEGLVSYFTVFAEIVFLALTIPISDAFLDRIYQTLIENINSPVYPICYFCLDNLSTLIHFFPHLGFIHPFSLQSLYEMMTYQDPELNTRSIQLLYIIANKENGLDILTEFLDFIPKAPIYLRDILFQKSSLLAISFSLNEKWCIDILVKLICNCTIKLVTDFSKFLILYVSGNKERQIYLNEKIYTMLSMDDLEIYFTNQFIQLSAYILGEYSSLFEGEIKVKLIIDKLILFYQNMKSSDLCKGVILSCFFKLCIKQSSYKKKLVDFINDQRQSSIVDISQRSCEYTKLLSGFPASFLSKLSPSSWQKGRIPLIDEISIEKFKINNRKSGIRKSQSEIQSPKSTNVIRSAIKKDAHYLMPNVTTITASDNRQPTGATGADSNVGQLGYARKRSVIKTSSSFLIEEPCSNTNFVKPNRQANKTNSVKINASYLMHGAAISARTDASPLTTSRLINRSNSAPINVLSTGVAPSLITGTQNQGGRIKGNAMLGFFDDDNDLSLSEETLAEDDEKSDAFTSHFLSANEGQIFSNSLCSVSVSFVIFPPNAKVSVFIANNIVDGSKSPPPASKPSAPQLFRPSADRSIAQARVSVPTEALLSFTASGEAEEEEEEEESANGTNATGSCEKDSLRVNNFTISAVDDLKFRVINFPDEGVCEIESGTKKEIIVEFVAVGIFDQMPLLTFEANQETVKANIPIIFQRWIKEMEMDKNTFISRWNSISDISNSAFVSLVIPDGDVMSTVKFLAKKNFGLDPLNIELPENIVVMCGVFKCLRKSIGFLLRFVFNERENDLSLMIKTTSPSAINILKKRAYNAFIL